MTAGYFAFADNASKRMVEILHRMGIMVVYETVRRALQVNATAILEELKAKVWEKRFFMSVDNMNSYEQSTAQQARSAQLDCGLHLFHALGS